MTPPLSIGDKINSSTPTPMREGVIDSTVFLIEVSENSQILSKKNEGERWESVPGIAGNRKRAAGLETSALTTKERCFIDE